VSDKLFEKYLQDAGMNPEYEPAPASGGTKRPDYRVGFQRDYLFFDVKGFGEGTHQPSPGSSHFDPYKPIRAKVEIGKKQFSQHKRFCCSLVLHNAGAFVMLDDPQVVFAAMLGDLGFSIPLQQEADDDVEITKVFCCGGKMRFGSQPQNRTIAAIIVLEVFPLPYRRYQLKCRHLEQNLGTRLTLEQHIKIMERFRADATSTPPLRTVVHENPFARRPLSRALFVGPYDERYIWKDGYLRRVYEGQSLRGLRDQARCFGLTDW
jgi:hypothetical protein